MLTQKTAPQKNNQENDICEACGTFVELGSVITEDDTLLILPFSGPDKTSVEQLGDKYIQAAQTRFPEVVVSVDYKEIEYAIESKVSLKFECTAEKLIYEMGLSSI